jgi:tetratricopeptide (TPR) repeat protein
MKIQQLEQMFSQNLQSPLFSILADCYYQKRLYSHAKKVCKIGLKYNPQSIEGQYVLAKILLIQGEMKRAEKILQDIVLNNPYQLNAILLLIETMEQLKRSKKSIGHYIQTASLFYDNNKQIKKYFKDSEKVHKIKKTIKTHSKNTLHISPKLATQTMYKLLLSQKKYIDAYALLKIMNKQSKNQKFVINEMKKIKKNNKYVIK